jgi:molecular chaperone GrpE
LDTVAETGAETVAAPSQADTLPNGHQNTEQASPANEPSPELDEWRERALRLQAEMSNYRQRQQRLAQDQIEVERQRLLGAFLQVVDDLERALATPADSTPLLPSGASPLSEAPSEDGDGLRRGIELTHRAALQLLKKEGVEPIPAHGQPFDPNWHEAVATRQVAREAVGTGAADNGSDIVANTVVQVLEPGYRLGDQLLRPAKVVVAV